MSFKGFRTEVITLVHRLLFLKNIVWLCFIVLKNKKDGGEDDSGSASRGNWWQGIRFPSFDHFVLLCGKSCSISLTVLENFPGSLYY